MTRKGKEYARKRRNGIQFYNPISRALYGHKYTSPGTRFFFHDRKPCVQDKLLFNGCGRTSKVLLIKKRRKIYTIWNLCTRVVLPRISGGIYSSFIYNNRQSSLRGERFTKGARVKNANTSISYNVIVQSYLKAPKTKQKKPELKCKSLYNFVKIV